MNENLELYGKLLSVGKDNVCSAQKCGEYKEQLQHLHDFVYVVESTPNPCDADYHPMMLECIIHKDQWNPTFRNKLIENRFSFRVMDYNKDRCDSYDLPDTQKRRLLFEMLGKWWFFNKSFSPTYALTEAIQFRNHFFKQEFSYLPKKFRGLVEKNGFCAAVEMLTPEEHDFLDNFIDEMNEPSFLCGCIPARKSVFLQRLATPDYQEVPELEIYERDNLDVNKIEKAVLSGDFLYMAVNNYYDCADRSLYTKLYKMLHEQTPL